MTTRGEAAIVTGSSKGIGAAIAVRLGRMGYFVYVTYKNDQIGGERVVERIRDENGEAELLELDVVSQESVRKAFERIRQGCRPLGVVVSNAVQEIAKNIEEASFEEWCLVTRTKIDGAFLVTKEAIDLLRGSANPNVIYITSYDGVRPVPDYVAYCVGTAGIIALGAAMAQYLPKHGIRVNCVSPGATRTPLWDALGGGEEALWTGFAEKNPMGRNSTPEDVANTVALLISDEGKYLNGNHVYVDGGNHLRQA